MKPTFNHGSFVLVNKFSYLLTKPRKKDIIACISPIDGIILIKRITKIENNKYFVQGDKRQESTDSRSFGMLPKENIIGKVIYVL